MNLPVTVGHFLYVAWQFAVKDQITSLSAFFFVDLKSFKLIDLSLKSIERQKYHLYVMTIIKFYCYVNLIDL